MRGKWGKSSKWGKSENSEEMGKSGKPTSPISPISTISTYLKGDKIIWAIALLLFIFSVFIVYSTGSKLGNPTKRESLGFLFWGHIFYYVLGFILIYIMSNVNYRWIGRLSKIGFLAGIILVLLTFIFGESFGEAKRSLRIFGISFQTIQLAEVLFIIYFAQWIARIKGEINNIRNTLIPILLYICVTCLLIVSQKTSGAIIMGTTYFAMLFVSQLKKRYFFAITACILITASLFVFILLKTDTTLFRANTAKARIEAYIGTTELNKETIITEAAIARGGLLPNPGGSVLMGSVGESFSDYIYAFFIEEYGALLGILLMWLYVALFFRVRKAAIHIQSTFGAYLAMGLGFFIVFQAFTHIMVCIGYFPATGETLPLVSRGGMSIVTMSLCMGILLNISQEAKEDRKMFENL